MFVINADMSNLKAVIWENGQVVYVRKNVSAVLSIPLVNTAVILALVKKVG